MTHTHTGVTLFKYSHSILARDSRKHAVLLSHTADILDTLASVLFQRKQKTDSVTPDCPDTDS